MYNRPLYIYTFKNSFFAQCIRMIYLGQEKDERIEDSLIKDIRYLFRLKKKIKKLQTGTVLGMKNKNIIRNQ